MHEVNLRSWNSNTYIIRADERTLKLSEIVLKEKRFNVWSVDSILGNEQQYGQISFFVVTEDISNDI